MGALSSSSSLIVPHILRRRPPFSLFKHLHTTTTTTTTATTNFISYFRPFSLSSSSLPPSHSLSTLSSQTPITLETQNDVQPEIETESESESDREIETESGQDFENPENETVNTADPLETDVVVDSKLSSKHKELLLNLQVISIKEKKELASYAHSLGKKLKSQQIGKSGVTDAVGFALVETLEANELLKIKIHNNCPEELEDAVKQLEEATGSVIVSRIGRTVIIYRPSLTKLIAEEKKKQAQKIFLKRRAAFKSSFQSRGRPSMPSDRNRQGGRRSSVSEEGESSRPTGRGRRGTSRF